MSQGPDDHSVLAIFHGLIQTHKHTFIYLTHLNCPPLDTINAERHKMVSELSMACRMGGAV